MLADGRVGYLRVDGFSGGVGDDFETALRELLEAGLTELVVDLRGDPGGFVDAAVDIASQFIADGAVFWEEDAAGSAARRRGQRGRPGRSTRPSSWSCSSTAGTASASEILAGALQDAGRAELVGERTFGKGTVQEWTQLPGESGGFRLSVAKWLTRDKTWVHERGLAPDVEVASGAERFWPGPGRGEVDQTAVAADDAAPARHRPAARTSRCRRHPGRRPPPALPAGASPGRPSRRPPRPSPQLADTRRAEAPGRRLG